PPEASHWLEAEPSFALAGGPLVLRVGRRYSTTYPVPGQDDARQIQDYEYLGVFRFSCGHVDTITKSPLDSPPYNYLWRPGATNNRYQAFSGSPNQLVVPNNGSVQHILRSMPGFLTTVFARQGSDTWFRPFAMQADSRTYVALPTGGNTNSTRRRL